MILDHCYNFDVTIDGIRKSKSSSFARIRRDLKIAFRHITVFSTIFELILLTKFFRSMPLPSVSANVLLAAACGSAVTCALQWAYTKFLGNNNSEKSSSHSLRGSRKKRNNSAFNKMEQGCLPEDTTLENSLPEHEAQCCAAMELGAVNGRTGKSVSSNRHFYCEVTDDGLAETNREVGNFPEEDSENADEVIEVK